MMRLLNATNGKEKCSICQVKVSIIELQLSQLQTRLDAQKFLCIQ